VSTVEVVLKGDAIQALRQLDKPVAQRILNKVKWLSQNTDVVTPIPLQGDLAGVLKLRVGDYRVFYSLNGSILTVLLVGHRREIYKRTQ
jgi:mRNA interferase RelE/StbE